NRLLYADVGHLHPTRRLEHPSDLPVRADLVRNEVDHAVGNDEVGPPVLDGDLLCQALAELDVLDPPLGRTGPGPLEHLPGHVDADDPSLGPDRVRGDQRVEPRAGTNVYDALSRAWQAPVERIGDPRERGDRGLREPLE